MIGCAELAPLSATVAEVRSLVVDEARRGQHIGTALVTALAERRARARLRDAVRVHASAVALRAAGFSIVPHMWVPEKIAHDCTGCALFRRCGQYAVTLPLRAGVSVRPGAAGRRDPARPRLAPRAERRAAAAARSGAIAERRSA